MLWHCFGCPALVPSTSRRSALRPEVLDDKNIRRRFRASNYQSTTRVRGSGGDGAEASLRTGERARGAEAVRKTPYEYCPPETLYLITNTTLTHPKGTKNSRGAAIECSPPKKV